MDKILIRLVVLAGGGFLMLNALFCALLFLPAILLSDEEGLLPDDRAAGSARDACGAGKKLVTQ